MGMVMVQPLRACGDKVAVVQVAEFVEEVGMLLDLDAYPDAVVLARMTSSE